MQVHTHLDGKTSEVEGTVMIDGQTLHPKLAQANNALWAAEKIDVGVYVEQAAEFAEDHSEDTIIVAVRGGEAVAKIREALVAVARHTNS